MTATTMPALVAMRKILIALLGIAVLLALALASSAFAGTQADWQFNELVRSAGSRVSYETLTAVVAGIRLALAGLSLLTAGFILSRPSHTASLLAAIALIGLPFALGLPGSADASGFGRPWGSILAGVTTALGVIGAVALMFILFLFPDGRFTSPRMRVAAVAGLLLTVAGIGASYVSEDAWWISILALLATILLGSVVQAFRYQDAEPAQRRQMVGFTATAIFLPWLLLASILTSTWPWLGMISGFAFLAMLPLGLYLAARRGLWGELPPSRLYAGAAVSLVLAAALAAGLWWRGSQAQEIDVAALATAEPVPVIFDADMAMDDIGALFYLTQHPAIDLRAVTVNGVAFAHCQGGVHNTLGLLELAGAPDVPVSCGRDESYPGGTPAPDDWRASADNLYGGQVLTRDRVADPRPAAELLADTIRAAPGEVVVLAVGPLTNLAEAFQADPSLAGQIREIVIMGGAVDAPGNVIDGDPTNQVAEWNFFGDPVAADIVLASGAPITLVPLDATNDVPFTRGFYERLRADGLSRPAVFTYNLMYMNQWWLDGGMFWWDTLAAAALTNPELVTVQEMTLDVITDAGPEMGRSIESPGGSPARVAVGADRQAFEALFLAILNHE
ncbi:MAG TPA: nucleoside hydrolase [Promineifilum sp.]